MHFIAYAILLASVLLGCLAATGVRAEEGNSTYNFFFQKAPGAVTVNQGGAPASPTVLVPLAAPKVITPLPLEPSALPAAAPAPAL